jgi:hypothetical protein
MDEFQDVDLEIAKLKQELAAGESSLQPPPFGGPEASDYWKRRMNEEKNIWYKKVQIREEEKKMLEEKLDQQERRIQGYAHEMKELERKFEHEAQTMQERLKAKETDLVIEKNRLFAEEKMKEAELKSVRLNEQLAELNAKIVTLKDEFTAEKDKLLEQSARERTTFDDLKNEQQVRIEGLQRRAAELEERLKLQAEDLARAQEEQLGTKGELVKAREELGAQLREMTQKAAALESEKAALNGDVARLKKQHSEETAQREAAFKEESSSFISRFLRHFGPLAGLADFMVRYRPAATSTALFNELLLKLEETTRLYAGRVKADFIDAEPFTSVSILPDEDEAVWAKVFKLEGPEPQKLAPAKALKEIPFIKPRVVIISGKYLALARKIQRRWPFLPLIVSGEGNPALMKELLSPNLYLVSYNLSADDAVATVRLAAGRSAARTEFWDRIKMQQPRHYFAWVFLSVAAAFALGYVATAKDSPVAALVEKALPRPAAITLPYPRPTNITADGRYLWSCDWLGQSIYRHATRPGLPLERIFYFPGKHFTALTFAGGYLWSADPWEKKINKHNADEHLTILASYASPDGAPTGLAFDGKLLWSCDAEKGEIYRHRLDDALTVEGTYKSPGSSPSGLYYDGQNLWSTDSKTNKIYLHRLDNHLTVLKTYLPPQYEERGFSVSGIAGNGNYVWICCEKAGRIYQYPRSTLREIQ